MPIFSKFSLYPTPSPSPIIEPLWRAPIQPPARKPANQPIAAEIARALDANVAHAGKASTFSMRPK